MERRKKAYFGLLTLLAVSVLLVTATGVYLLMTDASDESHPPADAPSDLCAIVGDDLAASLVPRASRSTGSVYSQGPDAACQWDSAEPGSGDYGSLWVRILRYGQVSGEDGSSYADGVFGDDCDAIVSNYQATTTGGLGDEACVATETSGTGGTAFADLVVRHGADIVWVRYYVNPGAGVDVRQRVVDVAARVLAGV
ncbi:hypothetical protein Afil01_27770 [Actinorhabdospora filicis]|uniref:DUF3558 domain-containing protein n=1 Tax=Actinorhabdospora filicis TaxID=1785913 RepID=A0A9W6SL83_9ACTN|nr:hypothetical protein [Actinorhabdospora filicis]GLZ77970.1 hypothetical protein Afil01_27770 [Actinorhabdospora filicis]